MKFQDPKKINVKQIKIIVSFVILFALYHFAEYMIVFKNNAFGFFSFQILFFVIAVLLGNWYSKKGLATWGLPFSKKIFRPFIFGTVLGIVMYAVPFLASISLGIEKIANVPAIGDIFMLSLPFAFGVLFSSISEDVLTRGIIYTHFNNKIKTIWLVLLSATIYLLNHIYRLNDGIESLLYIFLLGIVFIIPVIHTKNLWFTGGMHWAGNTFFFVSHNIIQTEENYRLLSPNFLFAICLALFIPIIWFLTKNIISIQKST
jgi:membrane protease YdiL (CAAX protease family)